MATATILPLQSSQADLDLVGGKGANLAKLARAGYPVPDGLFLTTTAYRLFVEENGLSGRIQTRISAVQADDPTDLEQASDDIRGWFSRADIPAALIQDITDACAPWVGTPVAVRSSATAEDLPDMSFAGQQDTFLNVIGQEMLLKAVVDCWSSLWTARAIGYRTRNNIPHAGVALSVVVQVMVPSEASGVLFTANPLTGQRGEAVIDATLGLGEALVGGLVEPDHYVVDLAEARILSKTLGAKALAIRSKPGGGVETEQVDASGQQALADEQILALVEMGKEVEALYDYPQDIEWAWARRKLYLLQSRPITSLFPVPDGLSADPLQVLFSFGSVQGLLGPMTPLGQDAIRLIFAGGASIFGFNLTPETQGAIHMAGERLWGNMTPLLRRPLGRKLLPRFLSGVDPGAKAALEKVLDDPRIQADAGRPRFSTQRRIAGFIFEFYRRVLRAWIAPERRAVDTRLASRQELERLQTQADSPAGATRTLADNIDLFRSISRAFPFAVPHIASAAVAGLFPLWFLSRFANRQTGSGDLALEITRGLPNNVTTEMDLELWQTAQQIRADQASYTQMRERPPEELARDYEAGRLPTRAQETIQAFLDRYGMRGLGEIDIGRPRWREDPAHILGVLVSYLQIEDEAAAPDTVFQRGEQAAAAAIARLEAAARQTAGGRLKVWLIRAAARRVRILAGLRESPKFHIIRMMGIIREALLESGRSLVQTGVLAQAEDLFFLSLNELERLADGETDEWAALVAQRRENYRREQHRALVPRLLLSDGHAFYEGLMAPAGESDKLQGSPVSPGVAEGLVRVVLEPRRANLKPGEILVCPGTDPAWTPLFLAASGLVMETGGMMTHGAIVAREYGIPAVVGVHQATTRLQTGQHVQVNGSTGAIVVLEG